jgi:hypothetical protein
MLTMQTILQNSLQFYNLYGQSGQCHPSQYRTLHLRQQTLTRALPRSRAHSFSPLAVSLQVQGLPTSHPTRTPIDDRRPRFKVCSFRWWASAAHQIGLGFAFHPHFHHALSRRNSYHTTGLGGVFSTPYGSLFARRVRRRASSARGQAS